MNGISPPRQFEAPQPNGHVQPLECSLYLRHPFFRAIFSFFSSPSKAVFRNKAIKFCFIALARTAMRWELPALRQTFSTDNPTSTCWSIREIYCSVKRDFLIIWIPSANLGFYEKILTAGGPILREQVTDLATSYMAKELRNWETVMSCEFNRSVQHTH